MIQKLIVLESDLNIQNDSGENPLILAIKHLDPLYCSLIVENMLDYGCNVNLQDNNGNTALIHSVKKMNSNYNIYSKISEFIISSGAKLSIMNIDGWNVFMYFCCITHPDKNEYQRIRNEFFEKPNSYKILMNKDFVLRVYKLNKQNSIKLEILDIIIYYNIPLIYLPNDYDFMRDLKSRFKSKKN